MTWTKVGCAVVVSLGLLACGNTANGGKTAPDSGASRGAQVGAGTASGDSGIKPGASVDLDGDGQQDDGVAIDTDGDGIADGVDTNGDRKVDQPLPGAGGADAAVGPGSTCNGVGACDDNFADMCDQSPDSCPTTQASGIDVPEWDCSGAPPRNVYAYATFPNGTTVAGANLAPGACVVFFEGAQDLFYAQWFKFGPQTTTSTCAKYEGCICPKGSILKQSYDRRLYAFTWDGDANCAQISIVDHAGNDQAVSNGCRKYLYSMHTEGDNAPQDGQGAYELPFSYMAGSLAALKLRLAQFPKVEVACIDVETVGALPWAQLMVSDVQLNAGYVAK